MQNSACRKNMPTPLLFSKSKILLVMKLIILLLTVACLHVSASGLGQRITLSKKNAPLSAVIHSIQLQSGYQFFYKGDQLSQTRTSIQLKNVTVDEALRQALKGLPFTYTITDKIIVIRKTNESTPSKTNEDPIINTILPQHDVRLHIIDSAGQPLSGASVYVKRTKQGGSTDAQGNVTLAGITGNETLVISFISYETKEINTGERENITVVLKASTNPLDEMQIIAYGQTTKRLNTGNVSTVKAEDIATQPVVNPLLALEGRVPGLVITQSTGVPGSGVSVMIQGQNSMRKGADPFYVIDGVPYVSQLLPSSSNGILGNSNDMINGAQGNPFNYINPNDIESIDVLKGADATSIYGSRAANGAIIFTTKKGKAGKTKVDASIQNGWGKVTRMMDLMNTEEYLDLRHDAMRLDRTTPWPSDYDINGTWDTTRYTNWQKKLIGGTAKYLDGQLNISGGNVTTQFLLGGNIHRETTVFPGDFSDLRGGLHWSLNHQSINNKFKVQFAGNYLIDNNQLMQNLLTDQARMLAPDAPAPYNPDGSLNWAPDANGAATFSNNPYAILSRKFNSKVNNLIGSALFSYALSPFLSLKSSFGYNRLEQIDFNGTPITSFDPSIWPIRGNSLRRAAYVNNLISSWIVEPQLEYRRSLGAGRFDALLGTTLTNQNSSGQIINGSGYNSDLVLEDIKAASAISVVSSTKALYKYFAVFGRLNYNLDNRYIFSGSLRRDGSSRFGSENRFNNFWSLAGAWIFSEEKWTKDQIPFLSFGKLRTSYGTTGNDQIGDYQYLGLYNSVTASNPYLGTSGIVVAGLNNPYLQWEETRKLEVAVELGFLKDRLYLSANWFRNRSSNQLLSYPLPLTTGFGSIPSNFAATVQNSGWEFVVNTVNIKNEHLSWETAVNLTIPSNKLVSFPGLESSSYSDLYIVGKSLNIMKAYKLADVNATTGQYEFTTHDGQLSSSPDFNTDRTQIIDLQPGIYGGIQNTFSYKGISLSALFQFARQQAANYYFGLYPGAMFNQPTYLLDRWKVPGDKASHQRANADFTYANQQGIANASDAAYSDASYIRLKNISLSWSLPEKWCRKWKMDQIRLFTNGQNLLTFTGYKGLDPENKSISALPPLKVWTLGMQIIL